MTDRELMQKALEALEAAEHLYHHVGLVVRRGEVEGVIASLRERLAQPEPAPGYCPHCKQYTIEEPMRREWVGLTKEEAKEISLANRPYVVDMIAALEARLKEKNK